MLAFRSWRGRDRRHVVKQCAGIRVGNPRHALRSAYCNGGAGSVGSAKQPPATPVWPGLHAPKDRQRTFHPTDLFIVEVDRPSERRARTPFAIVAATEPAADRLALNLDFARLTRTSRSSNRHGIPPDPAAAAAEA